MIKAKEFYKAQDDIDDLKASHTEHKDNTYTKDDTYSKTEVNNKESELIAKINKNATDMIPIQNEIIEARTDFWGKTHNSLKEKEDSEFQQVVVDNTRGMFLEQKGTGSLTVKNTLEGSIRNLKILGNTTGGYNSETSTSFPLQSVGQAEGNKISILSTGKNLYNYNEALIQQNTGIKFEFDYNNGFTEFTSNKTDGYWRKIFLEKGKSYAITTESQNIINNRIFGIGSWLTQVVVLLENGTTRYTHTLKTGYYAHRCWVESGAKCKYKVQIEEGTTATTFEEYKADKKDILLPFDGGLKGLESVQDEVDFNGKVVQKFDKFQIDSTDSISSYTNASLVETHIGFSITQNLNIEPEYLTGKGVNGVSDFGTVCGLGDVLDGTYDFNICTHASKTLYCSIKKGYLGINTLDDVKNYFSTNIVKGIYKLKTTIIHEITPAQKLSTSKTITTLSVESEVEANIEGEFPCEIGGVLFDLQEEDKKNKECLEIERKINKENSIKLHAQDIEIISNNLDMDFRILDLEMALSTIGVDHKGISTFAMSPYDMMKTLILNNHYDKADLDHKISVYLKHGRITAQEAQELYDLMEIYPGRS